MGLYRTDRGGVGQASGVGDVDTLAPSLSGTLQPKVSELLTTCDREDYFIILLLYLFLLYSTPLLVRRTGLRALRRWRKGGVWWWWL